MALQVLSKTNILNGNVVQASDISQSIDAFTGQVGYDITISGSFNLLATTGSGLWGETLRVDMDTSGFGNGNYTIPFLRTSGSGFGTFKYSEIAPKYNPIADVLYVTSSQAISSSQAVSASFASSAKILGSYVASGSSAVPNTQLNFIAGAGKTTGGTLGVNLPELTTKTLGQNVFVSLALSSSAGLGPVVQVGNLNIGTGALTFTSFGGDADFFYTIIYI
jgi:hypothetical protein